MINKFIAFDLVALRKKRSLSIVRQWLKAGLLEDEKMPSIQEKFTSNLYSPSIMMRVFLFFITLIGINTILGPIGLILGFDNEVSIRFMMVLVGIASILVVERKFIKQDHHYKSGVTEAGYYVGYAFVYLGLLGFDLQEELIYLIVALILLIVLSIRYLDLLCVLASIGCLVTIEFILFESMMALIPFITIILFAGLFLLSRRLQKHAEDLIWEKHFTVFDTLALLLVYLGGNYFVVRELSVEMMGQSLSEGEDIPFAFLFYALMCIIPLIYIGWGVLKREMLFIRVGLLIVALTVLTMEYYHGLEYPELNIAIIGGFMILISLGLMKYLKKGRNGYTSKQIISGKWDNSDLAALVASQTLGGHQMDPSADSFSGKGGEFGGGGASGEF